MSAPRTAALALLLLVTALLAPSPARADEVIDRAAAELRRSPGLWVAEGAEGAVLSRAELDQLEAALLFTARSAGLSWRRVSEGMGLASPQAAQQRFERVTGRVDSSGGD